MTATEALSNKANSVLHAFPKSFRYYAPIGNVDPLPFGLGTRPTGFPACLRIALLLRAIPDKDTTVTLVAKHLVNRRRAPGSYLTVPGRHRGRHSLCIQDLRNCRLTIAIRIYLEDAPNHSSFLLNDFQLHPADCKPSVLAASGGIFDRNVAIPVAFATRLHPIERAAFLPTMNLLTEADEELLIHHAVQSQQWAGGLLPTVQLLRHGIDKDSVVLEAVIHFQHIRQITCEPGGIVDHQAIEGRRIALGRRQ